MEARHHKEDGPELRRAEWVTPRPDTLRNKLRPLEYLHPNEGRAKQRGNHHKPEYLLLVSKVSVPNRERHGPAAGDENKRHNRDQDQREVVPKQLQREHLAWVRPGIGGGSSDVEIADQETGKNKRVTDQEDPCLLYTSDAADE